ncbi:integrase catalytic domain-containing protein [Trichonephila clavipes]|nr:integrase catalytic domain-containing protein [Trichonephila clavipes]
MMGDLPIERINPCRAFEKVGIDFAGPITTKCQHTRKANNFKFYICLFICMCTKAVHLELVSSLSAAAFLSALRRFVSRRGYPSDIYSDNGTNFDGASAYLKDLFQLLHNSNVQDYSSSKNIQWHFIPPYAPNFGGVWEASVKLTKQHLLKTLKAAVLNFEELDTILCQIEACINSRPLYPLSLYFSQVLTPGHFLIGCPLLELPDHSLTNQSLSIHSRWSLLMKLKRMFWSRW